MAGSLRTKVTACFFRSSGKRPVWTEPGAKHAQGESSRAGDFRLLTAAIRSTNRGVTGPAWFKGGVRARVCAGRQDGDMVGSCHAIKRPHNMKRRGKWVVAGLVVLIALGCMILGRRDHWPYWRDGGLGRLVEQALQSESRSAAFDAVLEVGAPAVPLIARKGLHDTCHHFRFLSCDRLLAFAWGHPRLNRWLKIDDRASNCAGRHFQAAWLLSCLGTNAQAVVPDLIDCLEHCPQLHYLHTTRLLDTLGKVSGTNRTAVPFLTKLARDHLNLRAAVVAYYIDGQTNLLVETCQRLAQRDPLDLVAGQELFWFKDDHALNEHLVPLLEGLYTDPRSGERERRSIIGELEARGRDGAAALNRLRSSQRNNVPRAD